uniref:Uncharacterized protein n=1 Tax=Lepeophtheirus salmonis TaxID=72036 RepID=A0A0K2TIC9_LEPSM
MSQRGGSDGGDDDVHHPRGLTIPLPRGGASSSCSNFEVYWREKQSEVSKSVPECLGELWCDGSLLSPKKKSLPSPRNIPKFIKHSFNKLWRSKSESPSTSSSHGQQKDLQTPDSSLEIYDSISMTQSTLDFIEETRMIGLPLIPFKHPSCYLHDGHKPLMRKPTPEEPQNLSTIITEADRQFNDELQLPPYVPDHERDFFSFPFIDEESSTLIQENSSEYIYMKPVGNYYSSFDGLE